MGGFFSRATRAKTMEDEALEDAPLCPIAASDAARRVELLDSFEAAGLGWFWATDAQGRLIYLSQNAALKLGWNDGEAIGKPLGDLFMTEQDDDPNRTERPLAFLLSARNSISQLNVRLAVAGQEVWWEIAGKPQFDEAQRFTGYRGSAKDITRSRESQRDAERLAQYDSLTGLSNRHRMTKRLSATLAAYRNSKRSCALLMLDLDRFKQVNDTLGHPAGDELLKQVAARLGRIVGDKGEIGRLGGDEFQIMLPDIDDRGALGELGQRLIQMISQPYSINGARAIIGTSVGIAIAPYDGLDTEELVKATDLALYAAKGGGRGQYRFYSSDLQDGAKHRRQVEEDLRDAITNSELSMHYQPLICAKTHTVQACEALMRWEHPERGSISPGVFIPVAEEIGIIKEMGDWALREVCRQAKEWPVDLRVAVNVSAIQFSHDDFAHVVKNALHYSGLSPDRLELEITESVFLGDADRSQRMFAELKDLGVRLALDDFGTGYSSLSYLRTAPFDKIKIDQSFVRGATEEGNNNAAILSAITGLAAALKMDTVAEGVEAEDELALVTERGATLIQGHIFSRAISHEELLERLEQGKLKYEPRGPAKYRADRKRVFRRIGLIHEDSRYKVVMRNLSKTGAMIEGLLDVPQGTDIVLDLGGGQLAVATVRRSKGSMQGVEFETQLISDGADGLCTRHRVSPYQIEAAGRPLAALTQDAYSMMVAEQLGSGRKKFVEVEVGNPKPGSGI
ncbi:EAL domain-containing protein [Qipengyuania citrea]|jgi:diguanylate cyclase (GGDEF)-like protein/PAS domain S-box-containing protein|uniref:EAL domain-containing protein n=1 Tax=Qipengyuania citrea TaxID=225971 RepID=A0ABY4U9J9_9SPHN|nr:EAL domain-containing protein [Qipengyuania citrea]USA62759.1 EAL domain-containing protein [Qipengyuania citrea]|tara:strand:- start:2846 stop:5062 length:2217 start_codon:yes stop_codon:yes gene_type:complete